MGTQDKVFNKEVMGKQLRKLRNSTGMNQENFAEKLNLSKDTISNYERGVTLIPALRQRKSLNGLQLWYRWFKKAFD